jgi:hypothetical protein
MNNQVHLRKHAIFKNHYRRAVATTPEFHQLDTDAQWAALRKQVEDDTTMQGTALRAILDQRAERRGQVLNALEEAHNEGLS